MATDIDAVISNFRNFASLHSKNVAVIGAGGGQLIDLYKDARKVIAIDNDKKALEKLKEKVIEKRRYDDYLLIDQDFHDVSIKADCIVFEFCLHEMNDIGKAVKKAREIADTVIIIDHYWDFEWIKCVNEYEKVQKVRSYFEIDPPSKIQCFNQYQVFENHKDLFEKVKSQGNEAIQYVRKFEKIQDIRIEFGYMICSYN